MDYAAEMKAADERRLARQEMQFGRSLLMKAGWSATPERLLETAIALDIWTEPRCREVVEAALKVQATEPPRERRYTPEEIEAMTGKRVMMTAEQRAQVREYVSEQRALPTPPTAEACRVAANAKFGVSIEPGNWYVTYWPSRKKMEADERARVERTERMAARAPREKKRPVKRATAARRAAAAVTLEIMGDGSVRVGGDVAAFLMLLSGKVATS